MTTGQFIGLIVAIIGSGGLWHLIENRLERRDHVKDAKNETASKDDVKELEESLENCTRSCLSMMAFILMPWQEHVMAREEPYVGINEYNSMDKIYKAYRKLGGNSTVQRRQEYINEEYKRIPDVDIEGIEEQGGMAQ